MEPIGRRPKWVWIVIGMYLLLLLSVLFLPAWGVFDPAFGSDMLVPASIAAFLVEFFPAKVRYTSLSIPYHLGNGEFGGWLPFIYTGIVAATVAGAGYQPFFGVFDLRGFNASNDPNGNIFAGLAYTIIVAIVTAVVGWFFIPETRHRKIWEEVGGETAGVGAPVIP